MITNNNKLAVLLVLFSIAISFADATRIVTHGANDIHTN